MRTLIKNGFVVSVDEAIGNRAGADILIENGRIVAIQQSIEAADAQAFDASGCIVCPGFVDTHHHIWQTAIRGITADWSLRDYIVGIRLAIAAAFIPEDMYAAQLAGVLGALNCGVTTTADYCHNLNSPDHADESIRGLNEAGGRVIWCYGFNKPPLPEPAFASLDDRVNFLRSTAARHFSSREGLVTLGVAPEEPRFWADDQQGARQFAAAREVAAHIFWHANSSRGLGDDSYRRDVGRAERLGLLGPDVTLVHMNQSEVDEWESVARSGAHLSLTPETELQMNMGWPPVEEARARGIAFGLGVDIVSNNSPDLRFQARLLLQAERYRLDAGQAGSMRAGVPIDCAEALYWLTMGGARASGLDAEIGSLSPGKAADLQIYDARGITMAGWDRANPAGALLLHAGTEHLSAVMVAGRFVKCNGRLVADEARAARLLQNANDRIRSAMEAHGGIAGAVARDLCDFESGVGGTGGAPAAELIASR